MLARSGGRAGGLGWWVGDEANGPALSPSPQPQPSAPALGHKGWNADTNAGYPR